jgi:hypothetical protein
METAGKNALKSDETMISARLTECFGIRYPIVCAQWHWLQEEHLRLRSHALVGLESWGGGYAGTLGGEPDLETELILQLDIPFGFWFGLCN